MKARRESEVAQSCLTLSDLVDRSLPGSSVHGIFQARVLEWGAVAFSNLPIDTLVTGHLLVATRVLDPVKEEKWGSISQNIPHA